MLSARYLKLDAELRVGASFYSIYSKAVFCCICNAPCFPYKIKWYHFDVEMNTLSFQFFDDVEYLLDGLNETRSISTRCVSALDFASHCAQPSFRVNLRAHGMGPKIFSALQDAPSDKVGFCFSLMYNLLS